MLASPKPIGVNIVVEVRPCRPKQSKRHEKSGLIYIRGALLGVESRYTFRELCEDSTSF